MFLKITIGVARWLGNFIPPIEDKPTDPEPEIEWKHLCFVCQDGVIKYFLDGKLVPLSKEKDWTIEFWSRVSKGSLG